MVTHLTTNPPVRCLNRAERTGSLVFNVLWSYVEDEARLQQYNIITVCYFAPLCCSPHFHHCTETCPHHPSACVAKREDWYNGKQSYRRRQLEETA